MSRHVLVLVAIAGCAGHASSAGRNSAPDDAAGEEDAAVPTRPDAAADRASAPDGEGSPVPDTAPPMPPPAGACAKLFGGGALSEWVHYDAAGKLVYKPLDQRGDRIMDFSSAGYLGGGVALPEVPTVMTIGPSGGDDSAAIQAALDAVAQRPLDSRGLRGALLLKSGKYTATKTITSEPGLTPAARLS